jgi:hypothetical protein
MKIELPEIPPEERTPLVEALLGFIRQLQDVVEKQAEEIRRLKDEVAIAKRQKPKPQIRPSQLESPPPASPDAEGEKRPGSAKRSKTVALIIHREVTLHLPEPPAGAVVTHYEPYVVQELKIECENTRYLRARYRLPGGGSALAPLPDGVLPDGHFGPRLICYILDQHHHARVTQPLLLEQLREFGVDISAGQLSRTLTENKDAFHREKLETLAAGLRTASYVGVDDTGARHRGRNGVCTVVRNDLFAFFESGDSKSRINFLAVLQGGAAAPPVYAFNETALDYCRRMKLSADIVRRLRDGPERIEGVEAWRSHLRERDVVNERYVRIATEGALLGGLIEAGVSPELAILSDGASQFDLLVHASCWIHAERPLARLIPHHDEHRSQIEQVRAEIWAFYRDLKAYRERPDAASKPLLEARFDTLAGRRTDYPSINQPLKEMAAHRADLLRVLDRPAVPLHNNGAESDIREYVQKRKISGGTRSEDGRRCRDTFASLKKTCRKLGVRFWDYLTDRLLDAGRIPRLSDLIRRRASASLAA